MASTAQKSPKKRVRRSVSIARLMNDVPLEVVLPTVSLWQQAAPPSCADTSGPPERVRLERRVDLDVAVEVRPDQAAVAVGHRADLEPVLLIDVQYLLGHAVALGLEEARPPQNVAGAAARLGDDLFAHVLDVQGAAVLG